jgi:hypothetical protein
LPSAKAAEAIAASLWRIYGPEVEVRFRDAAEPEIEAERVELLSEVGSEGAPLPTIFLDGELLFTGVINPLRVVAAVAERMLEHRQRELSEKQTD